MTKIKLSTPQFVLLTNLVNADPKIAQRRLRRGTGFCALPLGGFRGSDRALPVIGLHLSTAIALCHKGLADLSRFRFPHTTHYFMRPTEAGIKHWNEVNAACRAK